MRSRGDVMYCDVKSNCVNELRNGCVVSSDGRTFSACVHFHEGDRPQPIKDPNYNAQERYEKEYHQVPASDEEDTDLSVVLSYLAGSKQMRDMKHPQMMRACPLCRGDKYIRFLDSPDIVCPKCNGTGQQPCQPVDDKVV
jgi:hypothetical protein